MSTNPKSRAFGLDQEIHGHLVSLGRPAILMADASPAVISLLTDTLHADYELMVAESGPEALEIAFARIPDLVLLEVVLPGQDGFQVCARLKSDARTRDVPIIFVTDSDEGEVHGLELGAIDFVIKPIKTGVLALRIGNHLALKRNRDLLQNQSLIDSLTGIPNRRHFEEMLGKEWHRAMRQGTSLSLALVALEGFKALQGSLGAERGDEYLRQVARTLKSMLHRSADTMARYGGDSFAAILPQTDTQGAQYVTTRFQDGVGRLAPFQGTDGCRLAIGVATTVPMAGQDPVTLLRAAAERLDQVRQGG